VLEHKEQKTHTQTHTNTNIRFLLRDTMLAWYMLSSCVCPSVCLCPSQVGTV